MTLLSEIMKHNTEFVEEKKYKPYLTSKFPDRKILIVTCMDTRLIELLPASMNIKNGDAKILKTAGAVVSHPFGSVMRSIIVGVYDLNVNEIFVVGHHDCGMKNVNSKSLLEKSIARGIKEETIQMLKDSGIELDKWLRSFDSVEETVKNSVDVIRHHPLMPDIPVHGLVIHPATGKLDIVEAGY